MQPKARAITSNTSEPSLYRENVMESAVVYTRLVPFFLCPMFHNYFCNCVMLDETLMDMAGYSLFGQVIVPVWLMIKSPSHRVVTQMVKCAAIMKCLACVFSAFTTWLSHFTAIVKKRRIISSILLFFSREFRKKKTPLKIGPMWERISGNSTFAKAKE